jgi:cytoskeletal protein CcmA (bactofilin family)
VTGNISAGEKVELTESGRVKGDIVAPRVVIADGAQFKGMVDMSDTKSAASKPSLSSFSKKSESDAKREDKPAAKSA